MILISDLFYSYGYDPIIDKALKIDFQNLITKNPTSVTPDLSFTVTSYDLFDRYPKPLKPQVILFVKYDWFMIMFKFING